MLSMVLLNSLASIPNLTEMAETSEQLLMALNLRLTSADSLREVFLAFPDMTSTTKMTTEGMKAD